MNLHEDMTSPVQACALFGSLLGLQPAVLVAHSQSPDSENPVITPHIPKDIEEFAQAFYESAPILKLRQKLGVEFKDKTLLMRALTHKSFVHEFLLFPLKDNETLEFLGDSIMGAIVSHHLFMLYAEGGEGQLSKMRGILVSEEGLLPLAQNLELSHCLLLGRGEQKTEGMNRPSVLADALEAVMGALFLDQGQVKTEEVVLELYRSQAKESGFDPFSLERIVHADAKSILQEKTMALYKELPQYVGTEIMENGSKFFEVALSLKGVELGRTRATSKKKAEKLLAQLILQNKNYENLGEGLGSLSPENGE